MHTGTQEADRPADKAPSVAGDDLAASENSALSEGTRQQVGEVLGLVKELKDARNMQTQRTTDIARCKSFLDPQRDMTDE